MLVVDNVIPQETALAASHNVRSFSIITFMRRFNVWNPINKSSNFDFLLNCRTSSLSPLIKVSRTMVHRFINILKPSNHGGFECLRRCESSRSWIRSRWFDHFLGVFKYLVKKTSPYHEKKGDIEWESPHDWININISSRYHIRW